MDQYGWTGKILWVDLTTKKISTVPTSDFEPEKYLGGVGLNTKIFWEMGCPTVDAFDPNNPLLISVGPLTGMAGPFNRAEVCGIAPQSYPQETFTYSGVGGKIASEIKYAGYDGLVIVGKSDQPVYLSIIDDTVKLADAKFLWGLDTFETQKAMMANYSHAAVLTIGPAGENLCRVAIILNETASAAGQGGYGAVMGSKNLKAIVVKGTGTLKVARPDVLMKLQQERMDAKEWLTGGAQSWGRYPLCGGAIAKDMRANRLKRMAGCHGCTYQCMGFYDIPGIGKGAQMCMEAWYGWHSGGSSEGYWEGNILSQKLGINNYELMGLMAWLRAVQSGIVDKKKLGLTSIPMIDHAGKPQLGGQKIHHQFLTELLNGMASGKSILSKGTARAAESLGPAARKAFNEIFPARGYMRHHIENVGSALHWAMDTRDPYNSCHDYFEGFGPNAKIAAYFGLPGGDMAGRKGMKMVYDRTEYQTAWVQNHQSIRNSLPICEYASMPFRFFHPPAMDIRIFESSMLSAVTGIDYSVGKLWEVGDRIYTLLRAVSVMRENRTRAQDDLSQVWFERRVGGETESLAAPLDRAQWEALKDRFYSSSRLESH